jgi:hypothetical protein
MSELIEREATITNSATGRMKVALGVVLLAAKKAMGTAITKPNTIRHAGPDGVLRHDLECPADKGQDQDARYENFQLRSRLC